MESDIDLEVMGEGSLNDFQRLLTEIFLTCQMKRQKVLSQAQFAQIVGVKPSTYSTWLNGSRSPDYGAIVTLAQVLRRKFRDYEYAERLFQMFGYDPIYEFRDPELVYIARFIDMISDTARHEIYQHVKEEVEQRGKTTGAGRSTIDDYQRSQSAI
jgi:transcriptional regulator with XRE-family HTH domain